MAFREPLITPTRIKLKRDAISYIYDEQPNTLPGFDLADWITNSLSSGIITLPPSGGNTASEGITMVGADIQLGSDTTGSGTHDFTKDRFQHIDIFNYFIESATDTILTIDGSFDRVGILEANPAEALHIGAGNVRITDLTASEIVATTASKNLQTLTTATYPSLTELSYVKGVTSGIQAQIDVKFTLPALTSGSVLFSNGTTIAQDNANLFWNDSTNRLGIGTTLPQSHLDIQGNPGSPGLLTLATKELTVVDGDKLGQINFNAPLESDGGDSILIGASIWAEADSTFTTTVNDTDLVFATGLSETATEKVRITSSGNIGVGTSTPTASITLSGIGSAPGTMQLNSFYGGNSYTGVGFNPAINSNTYAQLSTYATAGLTFLGFAGLSTQPAIIFTAYTRASPTGPAILLNAYKPSGTSRTALTGTEKVFMYQTGIDSSWSTGILVGLANGDVGIGNMSPTSRLDLTGLSLTGSAANSAINVVQTWNTSGTPTAIKLNITDTASNASSLLLDLQVASTSVFKVTKTGSVSIGNTTPSARLHLPAGSTTAATAPLKFTSGSLMTAAEAGAVEFLTDDFYGTITTGAARKKFVLDDGTNLTSGRVPFATTNGRLTDDADLTFATDTLTATKIVGTTSVKIGTAAGFITSDGSTGLTGTYTFGGGASGEVATMTFKDGILTGATLVP